MPELGSLGSVRGALSNRRPYRELPSHLDCRAAVAASLLTTIYHMLKNGTEYQDLGSDHFDRRSKDAKAKRLTAQLAKLGFDVRITPLPAAA